LSISTPFVPSTGATSIRRDDGALVVRIIDPLLMPSLLGSGDEHLRVVEGAFSARIHARGNEITITDGAGPGTDVDQVARVIDELAELVVRGQVLDRRLVEQTIRIVREGVPGRAADVLGEHLVTHRGRTIRPKTVGQRRYLDAISANTVTFGIGPAGTGKTYLAMGAAVRALRAREVNRLILTRPAVEAGERLGFLPGTLHEKIDPYLKPLWDALQDMMDAAELVNHVERGVIEVAPLAYMRGTHAQRCVHRARRGAEHDPRADEDVPHAHRLQRPSGGDRGRQPDRPARRSAFGLVVAREILDGIEGVAFAHFDSEDVVRHPIVQRIVEAYDRHAAAGGTAAEARDGEA
jgi:phosphate starvation-inducible protein PhoH and related proteins